MWMCSGYRTDEHSEHKSLEHRHRIDWWETGHVPSRADSAAGERFLNLGCTPECFVKVKCVNSVIIPVIKSSVMRWNLFVFMCRSRRLSVKHIARFSYRNCTHRYTVLDRSSVEATWECGLEIENNRRVSQFRWNSILLIYSLLKLVSPAPPSDSLM